MRKTINALAVAGAFVFSAPASADIVYDWASTSTNSCTGADTGVLTMPDTIDASQRGWSTDYISWEFTSSAFAYTLISAGGSFDLFWTASTGRFFVQQQQGDMHTYYSNSGVSNSYTQRTSGNNSTLRSQGHSANAALRPSVPIPASLALFGLGHLA